VMRDVRRISPKVSAHSRKSGRRASVPDTMARRPR
jgi:hypothetical protein